MLCNLDMTGFSFHYYQSELFYSVFLGVLSTLVEAMCIQSAIKSFLSRVLRVRAI